MPTDAKEMLVLIKFFSLRFVSVRFFSFLFFPLLCIMCLSCVFIWALVACLSYHDAVCIYLIDRRDAKEHLFFSIHFSWIELCVTDKKSGKTVSATKLWNWRNAAAGWSSSASGDEQFICEQCVGETCVLLRLTDGYMYCIYVHVIAGWNRGFDRWHPV